MHKKVAFIGSVGSGKTTIIESLSNIHTINTDVQSSVDIGKELTTVGIDYGHLVVNEDTTLGLYGVPGQRQYTLVWDFVKKGLWAICILVKNNEPESWQEVSHLIEYFEIHKGMPCVIGITHADQGCDQHTVQSIQQILAKHHLNIPVYTIDPRQRQSANLIMQTLIALEEAVT